MKKSREIFSPGIFCSLSGEKRKNIGVTEKKERNNYKSINEN